MSFGAYIISFADNDPEKRAARFEVHNIQLNEWLENTDIDINVVAMNYQPGDHHPDPRVIYHDTAPRKCSAARHEAFRLFYASDYDWGVIMDNDAMLYHSPQHNSAYKIIEEMQDHLQDYKELGIFFPINPAKSPFTDLLADHAHQTRHVFRRNMDLKGSLMFVKNFVKQGLPAPYPDPEFDWCEDGKLALDTVALGHTVMVCENLVLKEMGLSSSSFATAEVDRKPFMQEANRRIVEKFNDPLLTMKSGESHLLDSKKWVRREWAGRPESLSRLKRPEPNDMFEW